MKDLIQFVFKSSKKDLFCVGLQKAFLSSRKYKGYMCIDPTLALHFLDYLIDIILWGIWKKYRLMQYVINAVYYDEIILFILSQCKILHSDWSVDSIYRALSSVCARSCILIGQLNHNTKLYSRLGNAHSHSKAVSYLWRHQALDIFLYTL